MFIILALLIFHKGSGRADFKLQETKIGEANVKLPPAVKEKNSGLPTVSKDSPVVVEEMKFNSATGKMTLKVKW